MPGPLDDVGGVLWIAVFALCGLAFLVGGLGVLRRSVGAKWTALTRLLLVLLAVALSADILTLAADAAPRDRRFISLTSLLLGASMLLGTVLRLRLVRGWSLVLVFASLGMAGWLAWRLDALAGTPLDPGAFERASVHIDLSRPIERILATDRGSRVPVLAVRAEFRSEGNPAAGDLEPRLLQRVIRTSAPEDRCNCHGWVFAEGAGHIGGPDVERILQDNGYQATEVAAVGDVVIYRDDAGAIVHSGVVRALGSGGLVLIESKWGSSAAICTSRTCKGTPLGSPSFGATDRDTPWRRLRRGGWRTATAPRHGMT